MEGEERISLPQLIGGSAFGGLVFGYALFQTATAGLDISWLLLAAVTVLLVSRLDLGLSKKPGVVTISTAFLFTSFLLFGLMPSVVLAGIDAAITSLHNKSRRKLAIFNLGIASLSFLLSGAVVTLAFGSEPLARDPGKLVIATALLALCYCTLASAMSSIITALSRDEEYLAAWRDSFVWSAIPAIVGVIAGTLIIKLIELISFYAVIVALPLLAVGYMVYKIYLEKADQGVQQVEQAADLHLRTIEALAIAIDAKDEVTHDHVRRVQIYAAGLARLFGLSDAEIEALRAGALLHDIGKVAVPDYILNKPGALAPAEFEKMKEHTTVGAEILEKVDFPYPVVPVVRHHHERWDGRGYPDGLMGNQIPVTARILSVADCFDAMQEDRQYRKALTRPEAIKVLKEGSGAIFDPEITRAFLEHLPEFDAEVRHQGVDRQTGRLRADRMPAARNRLIETKETVVERIRAGHREVLSLYDVAEAIGGRVDLRDLFSLAAARLNDIVSYTTCALYLIDEETSELEIKLAAGRNADVFKGRRIAQGQGVTGWVVANRQPMHNCDPKLDFEAIKVEIREQYRTGIVVPLLNDFELFGALALYSTEVGSYEPDHLILAEAVAKVVTEAVASSKAEPATRTKALGDQLTGLPNARALRYRFEEQLDRAKRHRDAFCLVMIDLDGFKGINDQLGHQSGDHLLKGVARLLYNQIESSDFISRYGADEFVLILQVPPDQAPEVVRRLQRIVEGYDFKLKTPNTFTGISAGWACFGQDGTSLDELLLTADRRMHTDKARRRGVLSDTGALRTSELRTLNVM